MTAKNLPNYNDVYTLCVAYLRLREDIFVTKITIDEKEYETDDMSEEAQKQLQSVQFVNSELQRLQAKAAVLQTASASYAAALKVELDK
jgi:hypothetical protein